jgi:biotin synthase
MNILTLAQEIIKGKRITRKDDLSVFLTCNLKELCEGADHIREYFIGDTVDLCSIINGRSGKCPEDCKYCAQSAHNHTDCEVYDFLPEQKILEACKLNESEGVDRFSIVTAGRALTGEEFELAIHAYETMHRECNIDLCASMGFLSKEQLHRLHEAGVTSYHHNIETSRRNFPNICTTHTYDQKIETLKNVKAEGMCACSGGIIGMGETWEDRLDMAISLAELEIDSIPINALMPIKGTQLEDQEVLTEEDILRTIAFFRYIRRFCNDHRKYADNCCLCNDTQ